MAAGHTVSRTAAPCSGEGGREPMGKNSLVTCVLALLSLCMCVDGARQRHVCGCEKSKRVGGGDVVASGECAALCAFGARARTLSVTAWNFVP